MTTQTKALKEAHDLSLDGRDFAARQIILDVIANLEKEALAKPALMIYRGELCYKSQEYDQSFGMWCPVTQDLPFPEGTKFYTTPPQRQTLTDEMVVTAARMLNERQADACGVDRDDQWAIYSDDFKADARAMLDAAHGIKE